MLRHIRLLILDLDYLVFDCAYLKAHALKQCIAGLDDTISLNVPLPDGVTIEEGFRDHGFRWTQNLEIGLDLLEPLAHSVHQFPPRTLGGYRKFRSGNPVNPNFLKGA